MDHKKLNCYSLMRVKKGISNTCQVLTFFFWFFPKNRVGTMASWLRPDKNYFGSPYLCFLPNSCYCSGMSRSFALNMTQSHTIKL